MNTKYLLPSPFKYVSKGLAMGSLKDKVFCVSKKDCGAEHAKRPIPLYINDTEQIKYIRSIYRENRFCIKTKCKLTLQWLGFLRLNNRSVGERGVLDPHSLHNFGYFFLSKISLKKIQSILYAIIKKKIQMLAVMLTSTIFLGTF